MNQFINNYIDVITSNPRKIISVILFATFFLSINLKHHEVNSSTYLLDRGHLSRTNYDDLKDNFSNTGPSGVIVLHNNNGTVINEKYLKEVKRLTEMFENMTLVIDDDYERLKEYLDIKELNKTVLAMLDDGLDGGDIDQVKVLLKYFENKNDRKQVKYISSLMTRLDPVVKVRSLFTEESLVSKEDDVLEVMPLVENIPSDILELYVIEKQIKDNPLLIGTLLSEDSKATSIKIEFNIDEDDTKAMTIAYDSIRDIVNTSPIKGSIYITGIPIITSTIASYINEDNRLLVPIALAVVTLVLYLTFKSFLFVVLPLSIAIITTLWTLSIMSIAQIPANVITNMLPIFLLAIAVTDSVHVLVTYRKKVLVCPINEVVGQTIRQLFMPMLLTTVTSAIGFITIANTDVTYVREFGFFVALGIVIAFVLSITLLPACLTLANNNFFQKEVDRGLLKSSRILVDKYLTNFVAILVNNSKKTLVCSAVLVLLSIFTVKELIIDTSRIEFFREDAPIRVQTEEVERVMGGITAINIIFTTDEEAFFKQPSNIKLIDNVANYARALDNVTYVGSVVDFLKHSHKVIDNADFSLPKDMTRESIAQYLFLYDSSKSQNIRNVVDLDYKKARVKIMIKSNKASVIGRTIKDVNQYIEKYIPSNISYHISGPGEIISTTSSVVVNEQIQNIIMATVAIFITLALLFKSVFITVLAMVPLVFTVILNFSFMSIFGIWLDVGTAVVACISMGIGVDYSIHFISYFRRCSNNQTYLEKIKTVTGKLAMPIIVNSACLSLGFMVLLLSDFGSLRNLGSVISLSMIICAVITLILMPVMLTLIPKAPSISEKVKPSPIPATN